VSGFAGCFAGYGNYTFGDRHIYTRLPQRLAHCCKRAAAAGDFHAQHRNALNAVQRENLCELFDIRVVAVVQFWAEDDEFFVLNNFGLEVSGCESGAVGGYK